MRREPLNVVIAGIGGQGNVLASQIVGQMMVAKGYFVTIGETYGATQRGGSVMSHIRISPKEQLSPLVSRGRCDLLIALEPVEAIRIFELYGQPEIRTLVNTRPIYPVSVIAGDAFYPDPNAVIASVMELSRSAFVIAATEIALELGDPILSNIVMLGALSRLGDLSFDRDLFCDTIRTMLPVSTLSMNMKAFDRGFEAVGDHAL